jgi:hypothetical protein
MKTAIFLLPVLLLAACKKDTIKQQPTLVPTACINGPAEVETSKGTVYTWCGEYADIVEWRMNGSNVLTTGSSFTPTFTSKGLNVISATGKSATGTKEATMNVFYGKNSRIICKIRPMLSLQGNRKKYWAYLYNSKADWVTDAVNGNHKLVIDSVNCRDTTGLGSISHVAFFRNVYSTGSSKLITVEYREAGRPDLVESSWLDAFKAQAGNLTINNQDYQEDTCGVAIEPNSRWILSVRWKMTQVDTGGPVSTAIDCFSDDYVRFYADGTWKYFVGEFLCANETNSSGVFVSLPYKADGSISVIQAREGPLTAKGPYAWELNGSLETKFYLYPSGKYIFVPDR